MVIKQKWSVEQINSLLSLYRQGFCEKEIAKKLDRSIHSIRKKIDHLIIRGGGEERKQARLERKQTPLIQTQLIVHLKEQEKDDDSFSCPEGFHQRSLQEKKFHRFYKEAVIDTMIYELNQAGYLSKRYDSDGTRGCVFRQEKTKYVVDGQYLVTDGQLVVRYNIMCEELRKPSSFKTFKESDDGF